MFIVKYKTKKSAFLVIFLLGLVGGISFVHADLDKAFRKGFSDIVDQRCHSLMDYSLDDQVLIPRNKEGWFWVGKSLEFHDRVNCFINRSAAEMTLHYKDEAEMHPDGYGKRLKALKVDKPDESSCQELYLQAGQDHKGFYTECPDGYDLPFSSCRVSETLLNEWCGYHFFLLNKQADNQSFLKNIWAKRESDDHQRKLDLLKNKSLKKWNSTYAALTSVFDPPITGKKIDQTRLLKQAGKLYQMEIDRTEKTLLETMEWYRRFELNYRVHVWMVAELEKIKDIQKQIQTLRGSYATYPTKFINASSPY